MDVTTRIHQLLNYAVRHALITDDDRIYCQNQLLAALHLSDCPAAPVEDAPLEEILSDLCNYAFEHGLLEGNSVVYRDLFDTKLMGLLTPRPSEVIRTVHSR